jgi:hypothetical protein
MKIKIALAVVTLFGMAFFIASGVAAQDTTTSEVSPTTTPRAINFFRYSDGSGTPRAYPTPSGSPRIARIARLEGARLQFCERHQEEINTRLTNLGKLVANMLGKFDAIAARVQEFYSDKVLPTGKSVENYDELVTDVTAKKEAVNTALAAAQTDIDGFTCDSDDPKGQIGLFRTDMQTVKKAMHDYRTSIKNLIVAVKSVTGDGAGRLQNSASPVASPVTSP